ncbi:MAG: YheU family protein [Myxococcota bacterium]|nr:YheU family protein [Myxococcota bacterium]
MSDASNDPDEEPIFVPFEELEPETLRNLAEEFVTREGTDYGHTEKSLDQKVEGLMRQLRAGEARICFEAKTGSIHILARQSLRPESDVDPGSS